jgi:hypothetical protein
MTGGTKLPEVIVRIADDGHNAAMSLALRKA